MDILWVKISCLVYTLLLSLIFGILPYFLILRRRRSGSASDNSALQRDRIIRLANCFAGGVFLGALFLSMLPEGSEEFESYKSLIGYDSEFPFYNVIMVTGFFITAAIEYFAHVIIGHNHSANDGHDVSHVPEESGRSQNDGRKDYGGIGENRSVMTNSEQQTTLPQVKTRGPLEKQPLLRGSNMIENGNLTDVSMQSADIERSQQLRSILLLLALSFHSIFDGLALGLQDSASKVWEIFAAVALHKCIVSFCLGLDVFMTAPRTRNAVIWMGLFCLISPIGTAIGISVTSSGINEIVQHLTSSILQGLACGAFLYITFMEILSSAWTHDSRRSFLDIIFAFMGYTVMVIAVIWDD